ncbi:MAG: alkaline phosphatase D family protein [Thermoguttaceae bacterium]
MRQTLSTGCLASVAALLLAWAGPLAAAPPCQATGFKVGEVTETTAIVWTRLTRNGERNPADAPMVELQYAQKEGGRGAAKKTIVGVQYPSGMTVDDIRNAAPGAAGETRVLVRRGEQEDWIATEWQAVDPDRDFTRQFRLEGLAPGSQYLVKVESRSAGGESGEETHGRFVTAPRAEKPARVVFTVSTGQEFAHQDDPGGFKIYRSMLELEPDFFVHTGDIVYYDNLAKTIGLARYHWQRVYGLPGNVLFHKNVASYFIKDDHDTWLNDCWPTMKTKAMLEFTFEQGQEVFLEQVPMGEKTWRTRRWGKDLQIWMVEGRDFRSPNTGPDGPEKTIWGAEQKAWLKKSMGESDATFRILISPTPIVGPDRENKHDNHANDAFTHEGNEIREFLSGLKDAAVICGDRHWQYVSVHPKTGVREYSCGPASDLHAGGWQQSDFLADYHKYLNVIGGFLSVTVEHEEGKPTIAFRHHDVDGKLKNEERWPSAK